MGVKESRNWLLSVTIGLGFTLTACGGGGDGGGNPAPASNPPPPSASSFYQFVRDGNNAGPRPLLVVDPANPAAPSQLVPANQGAGYMYTAMYAGNTISNLKTPHLVYASGGKLWKVVSDKAINPAIPGSGGNSPIQISNEIGANVVCNEILYLFHEVTNIDQSRILYELPGDGDCLTRSNNVTKMVKFGDSSATAPTQFAAGVIPTGEDNVFDVVTGSLSHIFLVDAANADALNILDVTTGVVTPVPGIAGSVNILAQDTSDRVFLMDHDNSTLYLYTISTNSLVALVSAAGGSVLLVGETAAADSTHLYVVDATPGVVKKIPLATATGPGDVLIHYTAPKPVGQMILSTNRIILRVSTNPCTGLAIGDEGLISVQKSPPPAVPPTVVELVPVASINTCAIPNRAVGVNVFYLKIVGAAQSAHVVTEDGVPVIPAIAGGSWSGLSEFDGFNVRTNQGSFAKLFLTVNAVPGSVNGGTVFVYEASNPVNAPVNLGTIPNTAVPIAFVGFFGGSTGTLGTGSLTSTSNTEILFADSTIPNSLVRVPMPSVRAWFQVQ